VRTAFPGGESTEKGERSDHLPTQQEGKKERIFTVSERPLRPFIKKKESLLVPRFWEELPGEEFLYDTLFFAPLPSCSRIGERLRALFL